MSTSPIVKAGGTDAGNTLADTSINVITQRMITMLKAIAAIKNKQAVDGFNDLITRTVQNNLVNASLGITLIPLPPIPLLMFVDEQVVIDNEQGTGEKDWSKVYTYVPYVPVPKPVILHPVVIDEAESFDYPGFHESVSGDSGDVPLGAITNQNGHQYRKMKVGRSPFAPVYADGQHWITRWQQIS